MPTASRLSATKQAMSAEVTPLGVSRRFSILVAARPGASSSSSISTLAGTQVLAVGCRVTGTSLRGIRPRAMPSPAPMSLDCGAFLPPGAGRLIRGEASTVNGLSPRTRAVSGRMRLLASLTLLPNPGTDPCPTSITPPARFGTARLATGLLPRGAPPSSPYPDFKPRPVCGMCHSHCNEDNIRWHRGRTWIFAAKVVSQILGRHLQRQTKC